MRATTLVPVILGSLAYAGAATRDEPDYIDLRVGGGLVAGSGTTGALTLVGRGSGASPDVGLVIGLRGQVSAVAAEQGAREEDADLTGGALLLGLGLHSRQRVDIELSFVIGKGFASTEDVVTFDSDEGDYRLIGGEAAILYTFVRGVQLGATVGYSVIKTSVDIDGRGFDGRTEGVDAGVVVGYRF